MKTILAYSMAVLLFGLAGCHKNTEGGNFVNVDSSDKAMNEAIAKAKATSGDFIKALHEQKPGTKEFFVKKPYPTPLGGVEHIWIEITDEKDGVINGVIANEAEETHEVKMGQKVKLNISEISDWKYQDGNKLIGGYTIRYFVEKMSPKEREAFLKEAGFEL